MVCKSRHINKIQAALVRFPHNQSTAGVITMPPTVVAPVQRDPVRSSDNAPDAAKVHRKSVRKTDHFSKWRVLLGGAIKRARLRCDWNLKEFAARIGDRDERLVARWESGEDRAPYDELFADDDYRPQLIVALAELSSDSIGIDTVITVKQMRRFIVGGQ
jgi:hypothetical protein